MAGTDEISTYGLYDCQLVRATKEKSVIFKAVVQAFSSQEALEEFWKSLHNTTMMTGPVHGDFDVTVRLVERG